MPDDVSCLLASGPFLSDVVPCLGVALLAAGCPLVAIGMKILTSAESSAWIGVGFVLAACGLLMLFPVLVWAGIDLVLWFS